MPPTEIQQVPPEIPQAPPERIPWSATFASAARSIADAARRCGLVVPSFRSPPSKPGAVRTLRRWDDGRCVVAVRAAGRPREAVVNDLVAGVIAANRLSGERAEQVAHRLRAAAAGLDRANAA